jgi:hypothetical protein
MPVKGRSFSKWTTTCMKVKNLMIKDISRVDVRNAAAEVNWDNMKGFVNEQSGSTDITLFPVVLPR